MLQHVEFAGVHSGDAAMVLPPHDLDVILPVVVFQTPAAVLVFRVVTI